MNPTILSLTANAAGAGVADLDSAVHEGLELMAVGMGVVFTALILLGLLLVIIKSVTQATEAGAAKSAAKAAAAKAPAPASAVAAQPADDAIAPETLVVIAAAVAATVRAPHKVRRVRFIHQSNSTPSWAQQGRFAIQNSHRIRKTS